MSRTLANVALGAILLAFAFVHRHRMSEVSITWDEGGDLGIVQCIQEKGTPFDCLLDISQTRFPYLLHSMVGPPWKRGHRPHYVLSAVFNLLTLLLVYSYARRVHGTAVATVLAALYATCIPLLASGRMLMSHSNIILTFFTTASFVAIVLFARGGGRRWIVVCAVASGLAAASSVLAGFNGLAILAIYAAARRFAWRDLWFFPIAAATFFASSVIYVDPDNLRALVEASRQPMLFGFWNVFGTGSPYAPWWFPWLMLVVKVGPWWLLLAAICAFRARLDRYLLAFLGGFAVNLALKGLVFRYETPHHQVQWYPLLLLAIAVLIVDAATVKRWSRPVMVAFAVCLTIQVADVVRFFPHYLFYSAQYGPRFIGEFYGPAVMHAQGRDPLYLTVERILREDRSALMLVADNNILGWDHPQIVPFSKRDPQARYAYAFVDRLYGEHLRFPERDAYNALLAARYETHWTYYFPPNVWVYRILRFRD